MITTSTMTADEARALRAAHDTEVRALSRKPKYELAAIERSELAAAGRERIYGGPASKDELVSAILELRYPLARQNEAIHVLYHGEWQNSACEWCRPVITPPTADEMFEAIERSLER